MTAPSAIVLQAGARALERIRSEGLRAIDIGVVPAAAGGPKGLILNGLDRFLFGEWLAAAPRPRQLIGASIGAWRMAAAVHADPAVALTRLARAYAGQRYTRRPSPREVSRVCAGVVDELLADGAEQALAHPRHRLAVVTVRGRGLLAEPGGARRETLGFALAALANLAGRHRLAHFMERVVFRRADDDAAWLATPFDAFLTRQLPLTAASLAPALLASGSIPLVLDAVRDIAGAPPGRYWDGGIVDYHLALPYSRLPDLVLYPHFSDRIVPGWLDKRLPWRRAGGTGLSNVFVISPSAALLARLPRGKLPDRSDFGHFGLDHAARQRAWLAAVAESERMAEDFARWLAHPDPQRVRPLP